MSTPPLTEDVMTAGAMRAAPGEDDLLGLPATELKRLIASGDISPVEIAEACLDRIAGVNPVLNAVVALDADQVRAQARASERRILAGGTPRPLEGIPVAIKDLSETANLRTTFGSPLFRDYVPAHDERMVAALREAGAIILCKTNTPEFGAGANTVNAVYGATRNPFDPALSCGGSSGGAAVAVATGMAPLATGSDNGGSLRIPASFCGVVGFRPSPGLVPSSRRALGYSPLAVDGPMAASVADAALLLSGMAGYDPVDPLSHPVDAAAFASLPKVDLSSLRIAASETLGFAKVGRSVRALFRERCRLIAPAVRSLSPRDPDLGENIDRTYRVRRAEGFLVKHLANYRTRPEMLGPQVRANVEQALGFTFEDHAAAHAEQTRMSRVFQSFFDEFDLLICPSAAAPPFPVEQPYVDRIDGEPLDFYLDWLAITYGLTLTGHPVLTLPCGLDADGLPVGIQVCGPRGADRFVLAAGVALEDLLVAHGCGRPRPNLEALASGSIGAGEGFRAR